jgi:hypothetical protein
MTPRLVERLGFQLSALLLGTAVGTLRALHRLSS